MMSLLPNMLSRFVIAFLPRSKQSFNLTAAVTVCNDFWSPREKTATGRRSRIWAPGDVCLCSNVERSLNMQISGAGEKHSELKEALGGLMASQHPLSCPLQTPAAATSLPTPAGSSVFFHVPSSAAPDPAHNPPESIPQRGCNRNGCTEVHFQNFILIWSEKMRRPIVHMGRPTVSLGGEAKSDSPDAILLGGGGCAGP